MLPGPVFNVELLTTARRPQYYVVRVVYGLVLLYFVWSSDPTLYPGYSRSYANGMTIQEMAQLGMRLFLWFVVIQSFAVLILTPALVAGVIADEKRRKTLHYLLSSCLSSGEIILGKLLARMLQLGVLVAVGLPVMSLLSLFGGVDPKLVVFVFAATTTTAFFLSALAILVSTHARRPREAITLVYLLEVAWLFVPAMISTFMPRSSPLWVRVYDWIKPVNDWIAPTSPFGLVMALGPSWLRGSRAFVGAVAWMMGLQVAYGALFVLVAVLRLRPVCRGEGEGGRGAGRLAGMRRGRRILPRPECGDDAMMWKERYVSRTNATTKAVAGLIALAVLVALGSTTYDFARPAFVELATFGYGSYGDNAARSEFNSFLRVVCTVTYILWALGIAAAASGGLSGEREEDTWTTLVSSPLDGIEILRAKMFGAVWGLRWLGALLVAFWVLGLLAGSIHPFGIAAVAIETVVYLGFVTALGTYASLRAKTSARALVVTIAILFVLNGAYLMCCIPFRTDSSLIALGVTPAIEAFSLFSHEDVRGFLDNGNSFSRSQFWRGEVILTGFLSLLAYALAAVVLVDRAISRFDQEAGRPDRRGMNDPGPAIRFPDDPGDEKGPPRI